MKSSLLKSFKILFLIVFLSIILLSTNVESKKKAPGGGMGGMGGGGKWIIWLHEKI